MAAESSNHESSIHVRRADLQDYEAMASLSSELGYPSAKGDVLRHLDDLIKSPQDEIFIAFDDTETVRGWIHVFVTYRLMVPPFADLGGLIVTESHRGRGIGNQLLLAAEQWAQSKGLESLRVRSNTQRKDAHKFYSTRSYQTIKSQKVFEKKFN